LTPLTINDATPSHGGGGGGQKIETYSRLFQVGRRQPNITHQLMRSVKISHHTAPEAESHTLASTRGGRANETLYDIARSVVWVGVKQQRGAVRCGAVMRDCMTMMTTVTETTSHPVRK